ncbi:UvrD-helicase domain-containing protein [Bifidobacterium eulemuris]|nr:UvrD-helicase domain-containing protein [Bifidobacterium eulemuris]
MGTPSPGTAVAPATAVMSPAAAAQATMATGESTKTTGSTETTEPTKTMGSTETMGSSADRAFLKPAVFTYDAFFQTIVRQYGLLVGFDQNTQPLSQAGRLQLASDVIDAHMSEIFNQDLGGFSSLTKNVLALSDAIASAMIGAGCTNFDDAVARVRAWDEEFIACLDRAIGDDPIAPQEPKLGRRLKKYSEDEWQAKRDDYIHARSVYSCDQLRQATRKREILLTLVQAYAHAKREKNMAEFSDFTIAAYQLIERFPSIAERCRRRYSHVLLDEYQDTSTTQAALLAALFHADERNRCAVNAVGDPFQSIYAWRGASPGAFRMFQSAFRLPPDARPYPLSVTRRNPRVVLEAANNLTMPLRTTPARASSSLMHEVDVASLDPQDTAAEGTLGVLGFRTRGQEIDAVVRFCAAAVARHRSMADKNGSTPVAVLFRSKTMMPEYQEALEKAGLRAFAVGYSALLNRPEVRDALAILHAVADHTSVEPVMRLLATPRFNVCAKDLEALARLAENANTEQRFRALVQAGLADEGTPRRQWAEVVREHRDQVANAVFLVDVLVGGDARALMERAGTVSRQGMESIARAARMLEQVQRAVGRPLPDVIRTAVEASALDIDTVVAGALRHDGHAADPTLARIPMDTIVDLVDTYTREIAIDQTPTLRGFMSWIDQLDSVEDEAVALPSDPVDVELMSVHQSKGLEWNAVAVVGLSAGAFPSNQGDNLSVKLDERYAGGMDNGRWVAPQYNETAGTWLTSPTAVPVPVRADAGILPRFPHDLSADADPLEGLRTLEEAEIIDDEVYGSIRGIGDGIDDVDPHGWYLTQEEEYGRRLHADERRLAYVALTRAREDVLLTYAQTASLSRDPNAAGDKKGSEPSNFWQEVHDSMHSRHDAHWAEEFVENPDDRQKETPAPQGFFVGERAREYGDAVVGEAWRSPLDAESESLGLAWPAVLSDETMERLTRGVAAVRAALETGGGRQTDGASTAGRQGEGPLTERARMLVSDPDLMANLMDGKAFDQAIKTKALRISASGRQNVTGLQARAGSMGEREEREYWRGIIRPIPRVASPAAEAGTRLHDWAERFVNAGLPGADEALAFGSGIGGIGTGDASLGVGDVIGGGMAGVGESRESLMAKAARDPNERIRVWAERLATSRWARRTPAWAERQIVVDIPGIGIVNGKLDAVFHGRLDDDGANGTAGGVAVTGASSEPTYTVVDWKTGKRPTDPEDIERKLAQLDMYRLLLAAVEGIGLDSIDATLYYVSEPDEGRRELRARAKTEQDILAELSSGIPEQSDND